jgi:uncharacterized membrane protein YhaH (DUF805 family)
MREALNPLVPAAFDVTWAASTAVVLFLLVIALVSLARSARRLTASQALAWVLVAILLPVVGPLAWLFIGRRSVPAAESASATGSARQHVGQAAPPR